MLFGRVFPLFWISFSLLMTVYAAETASPGYDEGATVTSNASRKSDSLELAPLIVRTDRTQHLLENPSLESSALAPATSIVSAADIERQNARSLTDALQMVPGAWLEQRGRKVQGFTSFRGQVYPYPDYAIDGIWQREFHELPFLFSVHDVEYLRVVRSASAYITSFNGMSGVVDIIPHYPGRRELDGGMEWGEYGRMRAYQGIGDTTSRASWRLSSSYSGWEGHREKNSALESFQLSGRMRYQLAPDWQLTTQGFHLRSRRELELASDPAMARLQTDQQDFDPILATSLGGVLKWRQSPTASLELSLHHIQRVQEFRNISGAAAGHQTHRDEDYETTAQLLQAYVPFTGNILRIGGTYNHWLSPQGKRFYEGLRQDVHTGSFLLVDEQTLGNWRFDLGGRLNRAYLKDYGAYDPSGDLKTVTQATPKSGQWDPWNPNGSLGLTYFFPRSLSLHLNTRAGVIPPKPGSKTVAGISPEDEKRYGVDVGARHFSSRWGDHRVAFFYNYQDEAILHTGILDSTSVAGTILEFHRNQDQDQYGFEWDLKSPIFQGWSLLWNGAWMHNRIQESDEPIVNSEIPEWVSSAGLSYTHRRWSTSCFGRAVGPYRNSRFGQQVKGQPTKEYSLGEFLVVDAHGEWLVFPKLSLRAFGSVENLFDERYSTVVGWPDIGRRFTVGMRYRFTP